MSHIVFYEKPGCINNTKQKAWLKLAGHELEEHNILTHPWTIEELKKFFAGKKIAACFNTTAPVIKSGQLDPSSVPEAEALPMMIADPILIKRPLLIVEGQYLQGFDKDYLDRLIGLGPEPGNEQEVEELRRTDLTRCPNLAKQSDCDTKGKTS